MNAVSCRIAARSCCTLASRLHVRLTDTSAKTMSVGIARRGLTVKSTEVWHPDAMPNPKLNPSRAGRSGVESSNVCDPDKLLSRNDQDTIEGYVKRSKHETVVAIIKKMRPDVDGADVQGAAGEFARQLHDRWGVGDREKNDGVVIFLSTDDRVVYISAGKGLESRLSPAVVEYVVSGMKPFLKAADYGGAIEYAVLSIEDVVENGSGNSESKKRRTRTLFAAFLSVPLLAMLIDYFKKKRRKRVQKCTESFSLIYDGDDSSCPYCLDSYNTSDKKKQKLSCGHTFCVPCVSELLRVSGDSTGTCVICAEPLRLAAGHGQPPHIDTPDIVSAIESDTETSSSSELRVRRYFDLYDDVLDRVDFDRIMWEVTTEGRGVINNKAQALLSQRLRDVQVRRQMLRKASREQARVDGSTGSSSDSFGGGRSEGGSGGGGTW